MHANHKRVQVTERDLRRSLGRAPTKEELANAVHMSKTQLERCLRSMEQRCYSFDQEITNQNKPADNNRKDTLYDIMEFKNVDRENDATKQKLLRDDLIETLFRVLDRENAYLVMLRFGLVDATKLPPGFDGPLTIDKVSRLSAMKPDKVRRRLLKSLKELKKTMDGEWSDFERIL